MVAGLPKRPLLTAEDRARLRRMAEKALSGSETGVNRAYCRGLADALLWLDGEPMTEMMKDVTR